MLFAQFVRHCRTAPCDVQIPDVAPVDLIERSIFCAPFVSAVVRPLTAARSSLSLRSCAQQAGDRTGGGECEMSHGCLHLRGNCQGTDANSHITLFAEEGRMRDMDASLCQARAA